MCFCETPSAVFGLYSVAAFPDKVKAVRQYPTPRSVKDFRSYLGLVSFYRRLIPKFTEIAKPLTELTRENLQFGWEGRQQAAFEKLKETLRSDQVLAYPNYKSHVTNKGYFDRRAKERIFKAGDVVYLFSPAKKPGQSSKFWKPWKIGRAHV